MKKEEICGRDLLRKWNLLRGTTIKHWLIFIVVLAAFIGFFVLLDRAGIGRPEQTLPLLLRCNWV